MKKIICLLFVGMLCVSAYAQTVVTEQSLQSNLEKIFSKQVSRQAILSKSINETEMLLVAIKERLEIYTQQKISIDEIINGLYQTNPTNLTEKADYEFRWRKEVPGAAKINENMDAETFESYLRYLYRCVYSCVFGNILWKRNKYIDISFANVFNQSLAVEYGEMFEEDFTREVNNLYETMKWLTSCPEDQFNDYWEGVFGHKL